MGSAGADADRIVKTHGMACGAQRPACSRQWRAVGRPACSHGSDRCRMAVITRPPTAASWWRAWPSGAARAGSGKWQMPEWLPEPPSYLNCQRPLRGAQTPTPVLSWQSLTVPGTAHRKWIDRRIRAATWITVWTPGTAPI